jgi:LAS superfamily LD-carboxypeptidase LdcB
MAISIGLMSLFLAYILNTGLQETLVNNLHGNQANVLGSYQSRELINTVNVTDNLELHSALNWKQQNCLFIAKDSQNLQTRTDYLTILSPNFGYKSIPEFADIVYLRDYGIETYQFTRLRKEPAEALSDLNKAAGKAGINLFVSSGYRTMSDQIKNVGSWSSILGAEGAKSMAAKPGFSEHHLGTTVDLLTAENGFNLLPSYEKTKLFNWLQNNAYKFGFTMSYTKGSEATTGYNYEPWHYRFVGIKLATELKETQTILQDYLYRLNNYCLVSE